MAQAGLSAVIAPVLLSWIAIDICRLQCVFVITCPPVNFAFQLSYFAAKEKARICGPERDSGVVRRAGLVALDQPEVDLALAEKVELENEVETMGDIPGLFAVGLGPGLGPVDCIVGFVPDR